MNIAYRKLQRNDLQELYKLTSNINVAKYMRFDAHTSIKQAKELLEDYLKSISFAIIADDEFAGVFAFKFDENDNNNASMSIFISEKYWSKGMASQVLSYMVDYAKAKDDIKKLTAYVVEENTGSRKVLLKNNFSEVKYLEFDDFDSKLFVYELNINQNSDDTNRE